MDIDFKNPSTRIATVTLVVVIILLAVTIFSGHGTETKKAFAVSHIYASYLPLSVYDANFGSPPTDISPTEYRIESAVFDPVKLPVFWRKYKLSDKDVDDTDTGIYSKWYLQKEYGSLMKMLRFITDMAICSAYEEGVDRYEYKAICLDFFDRLKKRLDEKEDILFTIPAKVAALYMLAAVIVNCLDIPEKKQEWKRTKAEEAAGVIMSICPKPDNMFSWIVSPIKLAFPYLVAACVKNHQSEFVNDRYYKEILEFARYEPTFKLHGHGIHQDYGFFTSDKCTMYGELMDVVYEYLPFYRMEPRLDPKLVLRFNDIIDEIFVHPDERITNTAINMMHRKNTKSNLSRRYGTKHSYGLKVIPSIGFARMFTEYAAFSIRGSDPDLGFYQLEYQEDYTTNNGELYGLQYIGVAKPNDPTEFKYPDFGIIVAKDRDRLLFANQNTGIVSIHNTDTTQMSSNVFLLKDSDLIIMTNCHSTPYVTYYAKDLIIMDYKRKVVEIYRWLDNKSLDHYLGLLDKVETKRDTRTCFKVVHDMSKPVVTTEVTMLTTIDHDWSKGILDYDYYISDITVNNEIYNLLVRKSTDKPVICKHRYIWTDKKAMESVDYKVPFKGIEYSFTFNPLENQHVVDTAPLN